MLDYVMEFLVAAGVQVGGKGGKGGRKGGTEGGRKEEGYRLHAGNWCERRTWSKWLHVALSL